MIPARVFISGQRRGVTPRIKRQLRRRSAVEPVIGHLKAEHRMGRNYFWYRRGDAANAHPLSCRLQLPSPDPLAQALVVPNNPRPHRNASARSRLKAAFFTVDDRCESPTGPFFSGPVGFAGDLAAD